MSNRTRPTASNRMAITKAMLGLSVLAVTALLAACSTPTPTTLPLPTAAPTDTPVPAAPAAPTTAQPQGTSSTSLDPCQVITYQEASSFAGASYGPGTEENLGNGGKLCTYGANTTNVFMVEVAQAPDKATVQADKTDFMNMLQSNLANLTNAGIQITQLPNLADGAVLGQVNISAPVGTISGGSIGVLKGLVFVGFSDLKVGGTAPSSDQLQAEAQTVLARLP